MDGIVVEEYFIGVDSSATHFLEPSHFETWLL